MARLDATDEEVIEAAKAVHAHDFIMEMEKGYQTEVNERGSSLSTGQRQLISFARALLNDPKILILDEATSSIDTHIELLIQDALEVLLQRPHQLRNRAPTVHHPQRRLHHGNAATVRSPSAATTTSLSRSKTVSTRNCATRSTASSWRTPIRPCNSNGKANAGARNRPGIVVYTVIISRFSE